MTSSARRRVDTLATRFCSAMSAQELLLDRERAAGQHDLRLALLLDLRNLVPTIRDRPDRSQPSVTRAFDSGIRSAPASTAAPPKL